MKAPQLYERLKNKLLFWIWKVPLFEFVVDFLFPIPVTVILTIFLERFLHNYPAFSNYRVLYVILIFIIVILWQYLLILKIFGKDLRHFIYHTKGLHFVTKSFGAEILRRFVSGGFNNDLIHNVDSLSSMLSKIEQQNGYPLSKVGYAILLDKAADFHPNRLWAIWDFVTFPIDDVFDPNGQVKADFYEDYFNTLTKIYAEIDDKKDKLRFFIYSEEDQLDMISQHEGWKEIKRKHQLWGFDEVYLFPKGYFLNLSRDLTALHMDDFVFFEKSLRSYFRTNWLIGHCRHTLITSLLRRHIHIEHAEKIFHKMLAHPQIKVISCK